jgi:hypothetical protein
LQGGHKVSTQPKRATEHEGSAEGRERDNLGRALPDLVGRRGHEVECRCHRQRAWHGGNVPAGLLA